MNEQYSQYKIAGSATPQTYPVPLATVGGEDGGRAAIVVGDEAGNQVTTQGDGQTSTFIIGQIVPGHDVFAADADKEVKKSEGQRPAPPPPDQKVISEVNLSPTRSMTSPPEDEEGSALSFSGTSSDLEVVESLAKDDGTSESAG